MFITLPCFSNATINGCSISCCGSKAIFLITALIPVIAYTQTPVEKTLPVRKGRKLVMDFEYPEIVKVQTWSKKEILIKGTASINRGENDDAFDLRVKETEKEIIVTSMLRDKDKIPERI